MRKNRRREILKTLGSGSLATLAAFTLPYRVIAKSLPLPDSIPSRPMTLTRTLDRMLFDGKILSVRRVWRVGFAQLDGGWRVDGDLLSVDVDAPPKLAALASMERDRTADESFPVTLDANGLIVFTSIRDSGVDMDRVSRAALKIIRDSGASDKVLQDTRLFLAQLDQAAIALISQFPQDLFFPAAEPFSERRMMDLPNGLVGEMEMIYSAKVHAENGLLDKSERRVVTRIGDETTHSAERWELV